MNFRHQVHIGHNDELENNTGTEKQAQAQTQVLSSANSTLSSRSLSLNDDDTSEPLGE